MMTMRQMIRTDPAMASITSEECQLAAAVLDEFVSLAGSRFAKYFLPKELRAKAFHARMLSAVLGRTPSEREPGLNEQIRRKMEQDR